MISKFHRFVKSGSGASMLESSTWYSNMSTNSAHFTQMTSEVADAMPAFPLLNALGNAYDI